LGTSEQRTPTHTGWAYVPDYTESKRALFLLKLDHLTLTISFLEQGGGTNAPSNLQALCYKCNRDKKDRDDTDFGSVIASYSDRDRNCIFCQLPQNRIIAENELAITFCDAYPVTGEHTLVVPKRHVADWFQLHQPEYNAIQSLVENQRLTLLKQDKSIAGFNIGINIGEVAGQTVFHAHLHLIPRRLGDVPRPEGGVRNTIPGKGEYKSC
jgi:ATP adenylyltransferase